MIEKNSIPNKFKNKEFSFIESILNSNPEDRSFSLFPKNVRFLRKEEDEEVILVIRKHWVAYVPHILLAVIIPLVPFMLLVITSNMLGEYGQVTSYLGLFVASIVVSINIITTAIVQWFYNVSIITDKRIASLDMVNIFQHKYVEILWRKIQDVSHDSVGLVSSVFDVGNIYIDTAGEGIDLTLKLIPRPRDVQEVINNLVDLSHRGRI